MGFLMVLIDGAIQGIKGAAKSAITYFDGSKWAVKEAGNANQILSLDADKNLVWRDEAGDSGIIVLYPPSVVPSFTADPDAPAYGGGELYVKQGGLYFKDYLGNVTRLVPDRNGFGDEIVSLLHFDTDLVDVSGKVWTVNGGAVISTDHKVFGAGSLYLNGTNAYLSTSETSDFYFNTEPFTIDFRYRPTNASTINQIFMGSASGSFMLAVNNAYAGEIAFGRNSVAWDGHVSHGMSSGQDYHIEIGRSGNCVYMFINGVLLTTVNVGSQSYSVLGTVYLGGMGAQYLAESYIDEFRVVKGECKHIESFTPPSSAYAPTPLAEPPAIPIPAALNVYDIPVGVPAAPPEAGKVRMYIDGTTFALKGMKSNGDIVTF